MDVLVVIPARYDSSRFAGKVLAKETGKYLIEHVYERARRSKVCNEVLIATDSELVLKACGEFGARCVMTSSDHQSGTDRIAEAVRDIAADIVVNVQGDEPELESGHIDAVVQVLANDSGADMSTLVTGFESAGQVSDPNIVKVLVDRRGRAIYFSRSVVPYCRDKGGAGAIENYRRHLGIYAYRKDFLMAITGMEQSMLEKSEKLEQLRVIENGYVIAVGEVEHSFEGIDTAEQYAAFVERYKRNAGQ